MSKTDISDQEKDKEKEKEKINFILEGSLKVIQRKTMTLTNYRFKIILF